jgi:hypothetical protein
MKASLIDVGAMVLATTLVGIVFSALGGGAAGAGKRSGGWGRDDLTQAFE